ncbi:hypothetical protein K3495_g11660 [Podosphaera aphanis]|nr:hypothetical protein K3495_g11660 [Podosphaera aphanis]
MTENVAKKPIRGNKKRQQKLQHFKSGKALGSSRKRSNKLATERQQTLKRGGQLICSKTKDQIDYA